MRGILPFKKKSAKLKATDLIKQFQNRFGKAMEIFEAGVEDVLSYLHYPAGHRVRISFYQSD